MSEGGGVGPGDKDRLSIHFSEEYRRAKRNVLFWAAVTILLATGTPTNPDRGTEVGSLVRNLEFSPSVLLVGSVFALVFMFAGYVRAERRLVFEHTDIGVARRLSNAADVAADLHSHLQQAIAKIGSVEESLSNIKSQLEGSQRELSGLVRNAFSRMSPLSVRNSKFWRDVLESLKLEPENMRQEHLQTVLDRFFSEEFGQLRDQWLKEADRAIFDNTVAEAERSVPSLENQVVENLEVAAKLSDRLRGWSERILAEELTWFKAHDRAPVMALSAIALIAAALRGIFTYITFWQALPG